MSSASLSSIPFLSFIVPIFAWKFPLESLIFLGRSLVFPILLFSSILCIDQLRRLSYLSLLFFETLHSNGYILPFLICLSLLFFSQLFVRPPQTALLLLGIYFPWRWSWSLSPVQCHEPLSIVFQAFCLSDLIPWTICHFHCIILRDLILVIPEWSSDFPYFLQFKSEFGNKEFMIWAIVNSWSYFCWLYRAYPLLAANNIINVISVLTIWWCSCVESSLVFLEEGVCCDQCVLWFNCLF